MTNIEAKALALVNEIRAERRRPPVKTIIGFNDTDWDRAFHRAIERIEATEARHAAELREQAERFSEAVERVLTVTDRRQETHAWRTLSPFIIAKSDPLVEAFGRENAAEIHATLAAWGGRIVWGDDQ